MRHISSILYGLEHYDYDPRNGHSWTRKPRVLTSYTCDLHLRMLADMDVYCLNFVPLGYDINRNNFYPNVTFNFVNGPEVHHLIDFDAIVCFENTIHYDSLQKINKFLKIPFILYECNLPTNISSDDIYISRKDDSIRLYPTQGFCSHIKGEGDVWTANTFCQGTATPILERPNYLLMMGDKMVERELESNYSHARIICNATPSLTVGDNPRLRTPRPTNNELSQVYNSSRIFLNLRVGGFFPFEIIEAMAHGCIVVTYPYPGIEDLIPENSLNIVVSNPMEARDAISKILSHPKLKQASIDNVLWVKNKFSPPISDLVKKSMGDRYEGIGTRH